MSPALKYMVTVGTGITTSYILLNYFRMQQHVSTSDNNVFDKIVMRKFIKGHMTEAEETDKLRLLSSQVFIRHGARTPLDKLYGIEEVGNYY